MKKTRTPRAARVFPGADEHTPSRAHYFSWIDNTWEGSTQPQTLANLAFFGWLRREYGMQLDIYAWDAGNLDTQGPDGGYWRMSEAFRSRYPDGYGACVEAARAIGCRMGMWMGPDGFGDTAAEGRARQELLVSLCRDHQMALFKLDQCCGGLRPEKQALFARALAACRTHCPDLIVLNHRIDLGQATPHATTYLWEGAETYIDVHMVNPCTAPHHRAGALRRGLPPNLGRLTEDHGVCFSSCLDRWDDDLVLQAFNRCLILAPEIYGSPWFLRDDEFPKLARIFNLHRRYRDILVNGMTLPEAAYGPNAVARGSAATRFLTLRNLTWEPKTYAVQLGRAIGLTRRGRVELRRFHPQEQVLGRFAYGRTVPVTVEPFRACLIMATVEPCDEIGVQGCDADLVRDLPGQPVRLTLRGLPGTSATIRLAGGRSFRQAALDGKPLQGLAEGRAVRVTFPGRKLRRPSHHKLADLVWQRDIPPDAEALYEATCFAADNNALEVRSLLRAGPTSVPDVQAARDAFFNQALFRAKGGWDRYLFDGDPATAFGSARMQGYVRNYGPTMLRIDFGKPSRMDRLVLHLQSGQTSACAEWSADLEAWHTAPTACTPGKRVEIRMPSGKAVRYLRIEQDTMIPAEAEGYRKAKMLPRDGWRASNLFPPYRCRPAEAWWRAPIALDEAAPGSYLCIALNGEHGRDGAWVAARLNGKLLGCPDRAVSFDSNVWEADFGLRQTGANYTYYLPVTPQMLGARLEIFALTLWLGKQTYHPEVWITSLDPRVARELTLIPSPEVAPAENRTRLGSAKGSVRIRCDLTRPAVS